MKKIILSIALFVCINFAIRAQSTAAGSDGTVTDQKPKTAVEEAKKTKTATTDTSNTIVTVKKPVKKSCCKKSGEGTPCNQGTANKKGTGTRKD